MPLDIQALAPMALLLAGAAACQLPPVRQRASLCALAATAAAAGVTGLLLAQLAPGERLAISYLHLFPSADLSIEIDGLSLGMAVVTLLTGFLLLLARRRAVGDRRQPWSGWLLTEAATLAVLMAGNLILLYAVLQVVTLAATGALDETSPRDLRFRLTLQMADLGLLVAAVEAVQAAGTSAIAGMPAEAMSPILFGVAMIPAVARVIALGLSGQRGPAPVRIAPALVLAAPAGYLVLRLLAIAGGHPPVRGLQVALFALGLGVAAVSALAAWIESGSAIPVPWLLLVSGGAGLALSSLGTPLGTLAACWAWAGLIPLAGVTGISRKPGWPSATLIPLALLLIPPGCGFVGIWLAAISFAQDRLVVGLVPLILVALACALPVARVVRGFSLGIDVASSWAAGMLLIGAFPVVGLLVVGPAARVVRVIPAGTVDASWWGLRSGGGTWPAALALVIGGLVVVAIQRLPRSDRRGEAAAFSPWSRFQPLRRPRISLRAPTGVLGAAVVAYVLALLVIVVR